MSYLNVVFRKRIDRRNRTRLQNSEFTLFASNCNGACICHDLGLPFRSPFVNLWLSSPDFVKFLRAPREYLSYELKFLNQTDKPYPVARLKDITVYFEHYSSQEEACELWRRRCERINWDNLFVLMSDRDGCTPELLREFDALPYQNKAVFTHIPYPDIISAVYIPGFEDQACLGAYSEFVNGRSGKKRYDAFDYVKWFNEGK